MPDRLEAFHRPLALPGRLVGVLGAVVQVLRPAMGHRRHELAVARDVFTAACADQLARLHGPAGKPCPARPWVCLLCPLAVFAPRHAVNLLRLKAFFSRQWRKMPAAQFMAVFGPYAARIDHILTRFSHLWKRWRPALQEPFGAPCDRWAWRRRSPATPLRSRPPMVAASRHGPCPCSEAAGLVGIVRTAAIIVLAAVSAMHSSEKRAEFPMRQRFPGAVLEAGNGSSCRKRWSCGLPR